MSDLFNLSHVKQLTEIQDARLKRGQLGIGREIETVIARLTSGGVAGKSDDIRVAQAKRYWDLGIIMMMHDNTFAHYLSTVPEVPEELRADDPDFPLLVLVEQRVDTIRLCNRANVRLGDAGASGPIECLAEMTGAAESFACAVKPTWIRVQDGRRNRNLSINEHRQMMRVDEVALTAHEGICAYLQHPACLHPYEDGLGFAMLLPGTSLVRYRNSFARLELSSSRENGGRETVCWVPGDGKSPFAGVATRRVYK